MPYQRLFSLQEEVFKTIASQKRLEIIQLLKNRELSVSEMVEMLGIRQANLSQHLSLLRDSKIVTARRDGVTIYYCLTEPKVAQACSLIKQFLKEQYSFEPEIAELLSRDEANLYPVVQDVVCRMRISVSEAADTIERNNIIYYFCGAGCKVRFVDEPMKYVQKEAVGG